MTKILCKSNQNGQHDFYIQFEGKTYFLFEQSYRKTLQSYFGNGVSLAKGIGFAHSTSFAVHNVMEKLPIYIKYLEKEYGISIFNAKRKRNGRQMAQRKRSIVDKNCDLMAGL